MNLSKSKYCRGITCSKMLWLDTYMPEKGIDINNASVLENGSSVGELAKELFGKYIDIPFDEDLTKMIITTKKEIESNDKCIITEASFSYDNNFCSVDLLKKDGDTYEIYEVKSSTKTKDIYIHDVSYQYYVLSKLNMKVKKAAIVHINPFYERKGNLDINKLFVIEDVTEKVINIVSSIDTNIKILKNILANNNEPIIDIGKHCNSPYECPYFNYCTEKFSKPNIFDLKRLRFSSKISNYQKEIITLDSVKSEIKDEKVLTEVEYIFKKTDKINKLAIDEFLNTISYPLYYLDFETFQEAVPSLDRQKPYEQVPFQYSLHYTMSENSSLEHKEFLAYPGHDPRRELAERLCEDIDLNVCTVAYNMNFEKSVIRRLADLYPDLRNHLMNIHDNMKDLMVPFYHMDYYNNKMQGSYSIKYVLPALFPSDPSLDYHNLDEVHNGSEAMNAYFEMSKLEGAELEKLRNNLLKYCELDTYAMVKILEKLQEL